ncbi:MAG: glycine cleavage system protein GcvH [Spirochaetales bacterium]|nr:MAG: glycine cleavage system protein GcvH [Spirochaetales bacterium]
MNIDKNAHYNASHEWARKDGTEIVTGISDHAQHSLGDIVFVELPEVGKVLKKGETFGVVESVKAASDLYMPMGGTVTAVNEALSGDPALVNREPFSGGWMIKYTASSPAEWDGLLSPESYQAEAAKE